MIRIIVFYISLLVLFTSLDCEVYQDRPKIKTSDGDLILEPAYDKNIYLRPNGPKSSIFVGDVNILLSKTKPEFGYIENVQNSGLSKDFLDGPNGLLQRLEKLESKTSSIPDDLLLNISMLWRRVNNLHRKLYNLQTQVNDRGKDECQSQPCQHGGTCLNLVNGYYCLCPTNWEGKDCDVDVNECRNFAGTDLGCQNGATCINKPGYYECLCRSGWFGLHCTKKAKDCTGGDFEMCGHGTCLKVETGEGVACICHQGWTTNGTGVACLTDVNECDSHQGSHCSVNPKVECINLPGSFRCGQCPQGYEGDGYACADINECTTIANGGCSPMVACHNTIGSRICGPCPPGYEGDGVTCSWKGSCNINRGGCHPSAQCVENLALGRTTQCICPSGMDGDGIGIHGCYVPIGSNVTESCTNNPCGIHGQCHMLRSGYTCICQRGYGGAHCDVPSNYCAINPCHNGGICRLDDSLTAGFRCECTAQYSGPLCQVLSKTCGGVLDAEEGSIVYPLSNTTYIHNSRCAWVIHTIPSKVINVTFSKFSVEESPDCSYDFLQIHDGRSSASQLIGRFCGNTAPKGGNIVSSHNNLYFWFRSDGTVAKDGFALHWSSIDPVCGGTIDATTHGNINSPGSPGKYPPNRDCYWHLQASFDKKIQLHFFALDIETHSNCSFDYLAIYDGSRQSDPLLNRYCNTTQPAPLQSAGSDLLIHFHSDAYGSGNGFQIAYAPVPGEPGCGGYFTSDKGELSSPSYNGRYLNNIMCDYKIKTSLGTKIRIDIKQFSLEKSIGCRFDYLKIYNGPSEESPLVGKFCGTTFPTSYVASSNTIFIKFHSDRSVGSEGFKISYTAVCQQLFHGDSGVIQSPGYPFSYPENKVCEYIIITTPGKAIQLTFQDFDIENSRYYDCHYDNVEVRDGEDKNATLLGRFCGASLPPVQLSTHNYMYIRFSSDLSLSGTGFYANYTTIATECGGIYRDKTGLINHPSDDSPSYKNDQSCTWILAAPAGMHIKLTWHRFEIENMPSCESDYLNLIEIDDNNDKNDIGKFCGTKTPPALTTSTNRLMIKFNSDSSIRSSGFSVSYTFLDEKSHCGGIFYKSHGFIYSPGWPEKYDTNRDCTWVITVPAGQQIKLNISQFDLERPIRGKCDYGDYLKIRNGATRNSPLIGQYCGKFNTKLITSIANTLYIHFHSDFYLTGKGFQLEWDGTVYGCGGTLTSSYGSISSPNYPDSYNENAECFYKIVVSLGSRIRITFTDLELERTTECRDDYVEIFNGRDSDAASFGKHCYMTAGLNSIETMSNYAFIKFRSDAYIGGKGFLLNYYTVCSNNITARYGVIESPDYPNNYPLRLNCVWNINVSKGNRINVTFTHFDIFQNLGYYRWYSRHSIHSQISNPIDHGCTHDFLQWKEPTETQSSRKYCGGIVPPMITTKSDTLQIKFSSGEFGSRTGFRLEWINYGCGGHIQKRSGSVSFNRNMFFSDNLECEWLIETPKGTSVSWVISELHLQESHNCSIDSLKIYNGQDTNSPLLSTICHSQRSTVQSTANVMLVKLSKKSSLTGAFFTSHFWASQSTCGGIIRALNGYIYSKNYPKNYDDNLDCKWFISVPSNHRIEFNFIDFDLFSENDPSKKCADSIKIYDNSSFLIDTTNYTAIICPDSQIKQITTKYNKVAVQFITDNHGNAKGFKANFNVICGAFITAYNDGVISNEGYIGSPNKNCTWIIRADQLNLKISLTITYIFLPILNELNSNRSCSSSYLRVYDGDDIDAPLIDEFCGKKVPPMIVSRGSAITVLLGSYVNDTAGKFSAHYSSVSETCGGVLTSEEGTIASPNYPRSYPIGANCEWTLSTSPGNKVYITFEQFGLEYSEGCNEDYLEIREDNGAGHLLGVFCGNDIPTNTTTASKLYIKFHSNERNSGRGFVLHYGFMHGSELINMERGEIASPLYPHLYQGAAIYSWRIQSNGSEKININIDNLEIPSFGMVCNNQLSIYDGYDETAPLLSKLCGKLSEPVEVLQTSSNMAYIKLTLDESNSGCLFHLNWEKLNVDIESVDEDRVNCGSNYTDIVPPGNFSLFESPRFPDDYDNDLRCEWIFQGTYGRHLRLNFLEFELEETSSCFADYLDIYGSNSLGLWKPIKEHLCESQTALEGLINSTKYLKVKFRSDSSVSKKGFRGKVSSVCGGLITELSGEVGPTWDDVRSSFSINDHKLICEWTVKVRPGRVIEIHFTHFNISNRDECVTSVTLRNGESKEAPYLGGGKYCGHTDESRKDITTSSNSLYISYVNIGRYHSRVFQSFQLHYEEQNIECGATSKLDSSQNWEVISSPNYPLTSIPFSECVWTFTGPPGEILRIDFIDRFDLDKNDDCVNEFVEIHDGLSSLSPSLGRYCSDAPGTIKTTNNMLYIKYSTQLSDPRDGFKANVSIDVCGGTIVAENGEIKSPGYPNMIFIPYNSVCEWRIKGNPRLVFNITVQDVDLPESETTCATKVTIEENIPGNTSVVQLAEFCDDYSEKKAIETSTNQVSIKLHVGNPSEWSQGIRNRGFRFTFNSLRPKCGGIVSTSEGYLTTPGYPLETVVRYCSWYITVPDKTRRVRLEIIDADTDKHTIGIYNDKTFQSLIQGIPGKDYSPTMRTFDASGNQLSLFLWLNPLATRHRFKAKFNSDEIALCGGDLRGIIGNLTSPNLERSYMCEWHYNSMIENDNIQYNSILVTARVNSSVARSRCRYTDPKLNIKSFVTKQELLFSRDLCGITEQSFRIPSTVIDVKAVQRKNNTLYFHLEWKAQPCGGIINVGEEPVNILIIPKDTNDTLDCAWMVAMPFTSKIELKMEGSFQFDCENEFIKISHGVSQYSVNIGDYCGSKVLDTPLVVIFQNLYIQYHTKASNVSSIKLMAKAAKGQCGGQLSSYRNVFTSPNYPKNYEPNQECSWSITTELGNRISLSFVDRFVIEDKPNCTNDAVIIYDWSNNAYTEMDRICGRQLPKPYNSTFNKMKVVLRTDNLTNMDGFKAIWTPICGGEFIATDEEQLLYSPGFPFGYPAMSHCTYKISTPGENKLLVQFLEFELEGTYPSCEFDNLTISGDDGGYYNYLLETRCGSEIPPVISNYNRITMTFKSDGNIQRKGFKLSYQIYQCGGKVTEPTLLSSHRGDVYDANMNCTWSIKAPTDKLIVFKFLYIDLESYHDCFYDYVAVYDDLLIEDDKRLALLCGHVNTTTVIRNHGNKALLQFVSDSSKNFKGFKVQVLFSYKESAGCGGHFNLSTTTAKTFKLPLFGNSSVYENYLDCHWTVASPPDTIIKIEFTSFHISSCFNVNQTAIGFSKCDCDFVEIRDGLNPNSFVIGQYCGHTFPPTLHTSGNLMSIRLSTDGELASSGFEAKLTVQQSACGQSRFEIGNTRTRVKSPGFETGAIPRGVHCVYYLDATSHENSVVQITILNLDLQPPTDQGECKVCNRDRFFVVNNPSLRNLTLGRDYVINHAADSFITTNYFYYEDEANLPRQLEYCGSLKSLDIYITGSITVSVITSPESDSLSHKGVEFEFAFSGFCGRNYTGTQGKIQTPYYYSDDDSQPNTCYTLITAPINHTISAYFISVNPNYWNEDVYLNIFDGKNTSSNKIVTINENYESALPVFSTGRYILLQNHGTSSEHVSYDMNYITTDKGSGCGGKLTNEIGRVTSPMYPEIYRRKSACEWELETPVGTRLKLHFETFDLGRSCDQNYVQLVDSKGNTVSSYCSEKPADYTSADNYIKIVFYTTMNNGGTGWVADFVGIINTV